MSWMTAEQALKFLAIRSQTLYANVSRGRIRAKPDPKDPRRSLYNSNDVKRLAQRRPGRRRAETIAAQAIGWGDPILASAISTVADERLWYRGRDAIALSERATLEEVAALLWQTDPIKTLPVTRPKFVKQAAPLKTLLDAVSERAAVDPPTLGRSSAVLKAEAEALLGTVLTAALGTRSLTDSPAHSRMASAWRKRAASDVLRRALVVLADHELNASTFAVRIAASTGASLAACVLAGLATLTGPLHGGATRALRSLVSDAGRVGSNDAIRGWLEWGQPLPTFGHPLYPHGDPRAAALMRQFKLSGILAEIRTAAEDVTGELPNIDFALAALADVYDLPDEAPFVIFALSRSVGWIAHALEQVATGQLIRPRARYIGPALTKETA
jgi:citrate synthase